MANRRRTPSALSTAVLVLIVGCDPAPTSPDLPLDDLGHSAEIIDLSPVKSAFPNPRPDTVSVSALQSVVIDVLKNDADTLSFVRHIADSTLSSVVSKVPVFPTVVSATQPKHGVVQINSNGSITYRGTDPLLQGEDQFTYSVVNSRGLAASTTVTVIIELGWRVGIRWPPPPDSTKSAGGH